MAPLNPCINYIQKMSEQYWSYLSFWFSRPDVQSFMGILDLPRSTLCSILIEQFLCVGHCTWESEICTMLSWPFRDSHTKTNSGRRWEYISPFKMSPKAELVRMVSYSLTCDPEKRLFGEWHNRHSISAHGMDERAGMKSGLPSGKASIWRVVSALLIIHVTFPLCISVHSTYWGPTVCLSQGLQP